MINLVNIRDRLTSGEIRGLLDQLEYPFEVREAKTAAIIKEYEERADQLILGAESHDELVGLIGLRLQPPAAVIRHIVVRRDHRGESIGRQMILEVIKRFALQELSAETDREAVEFYSRIGFEVESLGEKYPGTERFICKRTGLPDERS